MQNGKKKLLIGVDRAISPGSFTEVLEALYEYLQLLVADAEGNQSHLGQSEAAVSRVQE